MNRALILTLCVLLISTSGASATPTTTTETQTGDFSDLSGWALAAEARSGSNGNDNMPWPDFDLIDPSWNGDGGYITWDNDPYDGFSSGERSVDLIVDLSTGTASFTITDSNNNSSTAYYSGLSGTLKNIKISAAVETEGYSGWDGLVVDFYRGGSFVEGWFTMSSNPAVDTTATSYSVAEQTLTVTPSNTNDDKVEISGNFHFNTPYSCPGPNDLFNQIFIFTN